MSPEKNIDRKGVDVSQGEKVLPAGCLINSREIALIAALGYHEVPVYRQPVVAIVSTGEELEEVGIPLPPGKIYNSNSFAVAAAVREAHGKPLVLSPVNDRVEEIAAAISHGIDMADMMIITGGVSVGDYDLVRAAYDRLGAREIFWRVNMKPGMPAAAAVYKGRILLCLSGNPAAALVSFEMLGRRVIHVLAGRRGGERLRVKATLQAGYPKKNPQRRFVRSTAWWDGKWHVRPVGLDSPGVLLSMAQANALIDLPPGAGPLGSGDSVDVILIESLASLDEIALRRTGCLELAEVPA